MEIIILSSGFLYLHEQNVYRLNKEVDGVKYFRCKSLSCHGSLISNSGTFTAGQNHICSVSQSYIESLTLMSEYRNRARSGHDTIPSLITEMLARSPVSVALHLPAKEALAATLYRERKKNFPKNPRTIADVLVEGDWTKTCTGGHFLQLDEWIESDRLLVFFSLQDLQKLVSSSTVAMDGTFSACPSPFAQIYTLHSFDEERMTPRIYALCSSKSLAIYRRLFRLLNNVFGFKKYWDFLFKNNLFLNTGFKGKLVFITEL